MSQIDIYEQGDKVVFSTPNGDYVLESETARQMGEALAKAAYTARYGITPEATKSVITEQKRGMLITRTTNVMKNLSSKKIMPAKIAMEIVDTILAEVG